MPETQEPTPSRDDAELYEWSCEEPPAEDPEEPQPFNSDSPTTVHEGPVRTSSAIKVPGSLEPGVEIEARGRYRVGRMLGRGGMGSVYLAETLHEDRPPDFPDQVAVKFFSAELGFDTTELLKRELSSLLALRHERIPAVLDWSTNPNLTFAVFPYYEKGSLADQIQRGPLTIEQVWRLLEDLLSALVAAHRACLLHLDVKPGNVLCDDSGGYLLADFGISQGSLVSRNIITTGLGAPLFQSPEQRLAEHESFDVRTDLWGAGITAWYAAARPETNQLREFLIAYRNSPDGLPPLSAMRETCPPELDALLQSLLATDRNLRPGGAAEVLARVRRIRGHSADYKTHPLVPRDDLDDETTRRVYHNVMDPLWASICRSGDIDPLLVRFGDGEILCMDGEESYQCFVLISGKIRVERMGSHLATIDRTGAFLGEISTLAGSRRTATLLADGEVWVALLNAAQLEQFIARHPAVAIRLLKDLSRRFVSEVQRDKP